MREKIQTQQKETDLTEVSVWGVKINITFVGRIINQAITTKEYNQGFMKQEQRGTVLLYAITSQLKIVMVNIREREYKKYGIIVNIEISLHFQKNNTKQLKRKINQLEM